MDIPDASKFFSATTSDNTGTWDRRSNKTHPPPMTEESWENPPSPTTVPLDDIASVGSMEGVKLISIDRPLYLSLINLVQLMEPKLYLAINPLMMIGTLNPEIHGIQEETIDPVNDMIESIWGKRVLLVVPIVLEPSQGLPPVRRGMDYPVDGLRVATKVVATVPGSATEHAIVTIKAGYKLQDVVDCIESGRSIIKLTLLGKLVTTPSRSAMASTQRLRSDVPFEQESKARERSRHRSRSRHGNKRHLSKHRDHRSSPDASIYSTEERRPDTKLNRLFRALRL